MTPEEHELVARLFARQLEYTKMLMELLRSRGIVEGDDDRALALGPAAAPGEPPLAP